MDVHMGEQRVRREKGKERRTCISVPEALQYSPASVVTSAHCTPHEPAGELPVLGTAPPPHLSSCTETSSP